MAGKLPNDLRAVVVSIVVSFQADFLPFLAHPEWVRSRGMSVKYGNLPDFRWIR